MKLGFLILLVSGLAFCDQLEIFLALNPAGSFSAKSEALSVKGELKKTSSGFQAKNILLPIDSLETGLSLRDSHMKKKYFESEKFPDAVLVEATGKDGRFKGLLRVHGVESPIRGVYRIRQGQLETRFKCRLSDFKIKEANYMGIGVEDEVKVSVKIKIP